MSFEDVLIPIVRYGQLEDVYFTLSYRPILNEACAVGGVLVTLLETTARVQAKRLEAERERLLAQVQVDRHLAPSSHQGVGPGLAIGRDLATGMGGRLVVESAVGRGSTFALSLRRAGAPDR